MSILANKRHFTMMKRSQKHTNQAPPRTSFLKSATALVVWMVTLFWMTWKLVIWSWKMLNLRMLIHRKGYLTMINFRQSWGYPMNRLRLQIQELSQLYIRCKTRKQSRIRFLRSIKQPMIKKKRELNQTWPLATTTRKSTKEGWTGTPLPRTINGGKVWNLMTFY